jgi:hypothetical protein
MMARVSRMAGAILAETRGECFLVGNLKEPCNFEKQGFEEPTQLDAVKRPYVELIAKHELSIAGPFLVVDFEGESLARLLAERFVIERNGSVSERLWRLVTDPSGDERPLPKEGLPCQWLVEVPSEIWQIVRESVLRCL